VSISRQLLVYGRTGQVVEFYPPERELLELGFPASAATYSVWRGDQSNDETAVLTGTATLDAVSTTLSAAAGVGQTARNAVTLTVNTSIVPLRRYGMQSAGNQREVVQPLKVPTTGEITLAADLAVAYASGATWKGLRHTFTIDADFIADVSRINAMGTVFGDDSVRVVGSIAPPYRLRWVYTTGSTVQETWTYFDVVRQIAKHGVTIASLRRHWPTISDHEWRGQRGLHYQPQIELAEELLFTRLQGLGHHPSQIREGIYWDRLVELATLMIVGDAGAMPTGSPAGWAAARRKDFNDLWQEAIGTALHMWVDLGTTGAITPDPPKRGRWRR
jgi:hypothetical protein